MRLFQNLRPLAQYHNISLPSVIELEYTRKLGPPAAPLNPPPGPPWGSKKISGGFRHLVRSNPCHLAQETSQNHHLGLLSSPSVLSWRDVQWLYLRSRQILLSTNNKKKNTAPERHMSHCKLLFDAKLDIQATYRVIGIIKLQTIR